MSILAIFIGLLFLYSLVSARMERTVITAPIIFTASGMVVCLLLPNLTGLPLTRGTFLRLAEAGLILLLFTDASRTSLDLGIRRLSTRLLSVGMLLTIFLGGVAAMLCFPRFSIWEAGILAAILAPTDAGLGQVIVTNERVPARIRQALNVEAGLNDGLSVPFLLFFMALADGSGAHHERLSRFMLEQLGYGAAIGAVVGLVGGWLLFRAQRNNWISPSWLQLGVVVLPVLCALASEEVAASMFIAAFVAGLAVLVFFPEAGRHSVEFTEEWGQLLNLSVFFIFGAVVARDWQQFNLWHVLYAALSLTVVRMLPVAVALIGSRMSLFTVLFVGWFGPRGLASIVLALVYLEENKPSFAPDIRLAVMLTVFISIFAHGLSALPGIAIYVRRIGSLPSNAPEREGQAPVAIPQAADSHAH